MDLEATESLPAEITTSETITASHEAQESQMTNDTQGQVIDKPEGFDKVEFTPEQLARVNRIYGNMKRYEGDAKQQRELNEALVREITSIRQEQSHIVSHLQENNYQEAESKLSQQRMEAWNKGDINGFTEATDKLTDIRVQKKLAAEKPKQQPQVQQPQQPRGMDGDRIVDNARDKGALSNEEANVTHAWISETDQSGNLKRPWAADANDPRNYAAALEAQAVFNSPLFTNKPIAEKLREVDRRMGIQVQQVRTNVLSPGNLTSGAKMNNIKLDPAIEKIAIRTKFGGPKAKTDQDHVEAWKKAVAKQSKGGR